MKYQKDIKEGQKIYSKLMLYLYDLLVTKISNNYIWKCPTKKLEKIFNENTTSNHLDIGVGSGYFLKKIKNKPKRLALMDINQNSLEITKKRLKQNNLENYLMNIMEKIKETINPFDSISINHTIHCFPGNMAEKGEAFDQIYKLLNKEGTLFGATLMYNQAKEKSIAQKLMNFYNNKKIFMNKDDKIEELEKELKKRFKTYSIKKEGCAAIFIAKK